MTRGVPDHLRDDMHKTYLKLPTKVFMYTPDQIATMLAVQESYVRKHLMYYVGRMMRPKDQDDMVAFNIARHDEDPVWRVSEEELIRWMKWKRIRFEAPRRIRPGSAVPSVKSRRNQDAR